MLQAVMTAPGKIDIDKLCLDPLVTQRFDFKAYPQAYEAIESSGGKYLKVMIDL